MASYNANLKNIFQRFRGEVFWNEPLSRHTSLRVGGPADAYAYPSDVSDLSALFKKVCQHRIPYVIWGDGSNILPLDSGFRGIIFNLSHLDQIKILKQGEKKVEIWVGAGVRKQKLLSWAIRRGFSGVEFLSGVPGQVGGGLFMNAGTVKGCFSNVVTKITLMNEKGIEEELPVSTKDFSYRKQTFCKNKIITAATLSLGYGNREEMEKIVDEMVSDRRMKQPLQFPNSGSTFMNPSGISGAEKLSAGKLIESAGLKGASMGHAMVSKVHANFMVNLGGASSQDFLSLMEVVEKRVKEVHGITLEREVVVVGH